MNVGRLLRLELTVVRTSATGTADAFGDPTEVTTETKYRGWVWQEQRGDLDTAAREVAFEQWQVALDASAAGQITAGDRVVHDGQTFEVDGHPWNVVHPTSRRVEYVQATLRRT
jgi:hypothetical protein